MKAKEILSITKDVLNAWKDHHALQWGAAVAFYAALSLSPMLLLILAAGSAILGEQVATEQLIEIVRDLTGDIGAEVAREIVQGNSLRDGSVLATVFGVLTASIGASGVFLQLQVALNDLWDVQPVGGLKHRLARRALGFLLVIAVGLLLIASMLFSIWLSIVLGSTGEKGLIGLLVSAGEEFATVLVITLLLALIFKVLPDGEVSWRPALIGAAAAAVLFVVGRFAIAAYLGRSGISSSYGAAGTLVALLVWIYYSAQSVFLGAELTLVLSCRSGEPVAPKAWAERIGLKTP